MGDEILCNSNGSLLHISTNRSCSQVQMKQIAKELLSGQLVNILNECSGVECQGYLVGRSLTLIREINICQCQRKPQSRGKHSKDYLKLEQNRT